MEMGHSISHRMTGNTWSMSKGTYFTTLFTLFQYIQGTLFFPRLSKLP